MIEKVQPIPLIYAIEDKTDRYGHYEVTCNGEWCATFMCKMDAVKFCWSSNHPNDKGFW